MGPPTHSSSLIKQPAEGRSQQSNEDAHPYLLSSFPVSTPSPADQLSVSVAHNLCSLLFFLFFSVAGSACISQLAGEGGGHKEDDSRKTMGLFLYISVLTFLLPPLLIQSAPAFFIFHLFPTFVLLFSRSFRFLRRTLKRKLKNICNASHLNEVFACLHYFFSLKVHKIENFFGSVFEFYTISLLVMLKY